ncbi:MAG: hypothetical protein JWL77_3528 [Chthonomonadaceae bacterium]|nr:hypothetical protein [Chthonomonadaceae bacterium]
MTPLGSENFGPQLLNRHLWPVFRPKPMPIRHRSLLYSSGGRNG